MPDEKDRPSLKFLKEHTDEDRLHREMLMAQKVRARCALCRKPRCIYLNTKLTSNVKANVEFIISDGEYACGDSFTDDESYLRHSVVVRRQLPCTSSLETIYFLSKIGFPVVCCQCGGASENHWWTMTRQRH